MARQRCFDVPGGDTVLYDIVDSSNGFRQCTFSLPEEGRVERFMNIQNVQCRPDDVILHSYPKTGSNWLWEMVSLMLNDSSKVGVSNKGTSMIDVATASQLEGIPSPRFLNTHIKVKYTPKDALKKEIKTILLVRNPKDVVVSFYHHTRGMTPYEYEGQFDNFLQMFMRGDVDCGSYAEYLMEWQHYIRGHPELPVHLVYFENLTENCIKELRRIKEFLQLDVKDPLLEDITEACSIDKMRSRKANQKTGKGPTPVTKMEKPGFSLMRKGQVGDWRNLFTVAQSDRFDAWWKTETKGLDMLQFRYV